MRLPAFLPVPGACAAAAGVSRALCRCVVGLWLVRRATARPAGPRQGFGFIACSLRCSPCSCRSEAGGVISLPAVRDLMKMFADELIIMPCLQLIGTGPET